MPWQRFHDHVYQLGESPFWHPQEQTLYWLDIAARKLLRANVYMGSVESWDMPSEPGCMAPAASGGLVLALRDGIFRTRHWGGALERLATLDYDRTRVRANDGRCDALGRLWIGTVDETKQDGLAALYSVDCRSGTARVQRHLEGALTANGLAWSLDGATLYWADTPRHRVRAFAFDLEGGVLGAARDFLQLAPKPDGWSAGQSGYGGRPDGAAVDSQGNYWCALYEGQRVCQFSPDGRLLAAIDTPLLCPTMPCFGGEDLRTLYLTSVSQGRSAAERAQWPQSGCVLSCRVDVPGLPVNFFAD